MKELLGDAALLPTRRVTAVLIAAAVIVAAVSLYRIAVAVPNGAGSGYASAIWNVGQTLVFSVLLRKKDDRNLLAEKETDDLLSEPASECPPATASNSAPEPEKKEARAGV